LEAAHTYGAAGGDDKIAALKGTVGIGRNEAGVRVATI
jgi:hypothetical protein